MLVDVTFKPISDEQQARYREISHQCFKDQHGVYALQHPRRLDCGLYIDEHRFEKLTVEELEEDVPVPFGSYDISRWEEMEAKRRAHKRAMDRLYSQRYQRGPYRDFTGFGAYGICDTPEQLLEDYPHFKDDDVARVITFRGVFREDQSSWGGFRYHKNGKYVGRQKPRAEYLYDDKHIDMVCLFNVWRVVQTG